MRIYKIKEWVNHHWQYLCGEWLSVEACLVEAQTYAEMSGHYVRVAYFDRTYDADGIHTTQEEPLAHFTSVHKPFMLIVRWRSNIRDLEHCWGTYTSVQTALAALRKTIYVEALIYDIDNKTTLVYHKVNGRYRRVETNYHGGF